MIVDGAEVLYTMRNGKIVDPNIPMNGLVCYLDTRGKNNTDIYRNTLLDLSGNGNHGTLKNFNFTEESGYVKGLSGGGASGLKFDGVDDRLILNDNNIDITNEFTFMTELVVTKNENTLVYKSIIQFGSQANSESFVWLYVKGGQKSTLNLQYKVNGVIKQGALGECEIGSTMRIALVYAPTGITIYVNEIQFNFIYSTSVMLDRPVLFSYLAMHLFEGIVDNFKLYNRALTEQEITKIMGV